MVHTLGPWKWVEDKLISKEGFVILHAIDLREGCGSLVAAAPDLLDALEQIASGPCCQSPGCNFDDPLCDTMIARAVVDKLAGIGTGKTQ